MFLNGTRTTVTVDRVKKDVQTDQPHITPDELTELVSLIESADLASFQWSAAENAEQLVAPIATFASVDAELLEDLIVLYQPPAPAPLRARGLFDSDSDDDEFHAPRRHDVAVAAAPARGLYVGDDDFFAGMELPRAAPPAQVAWLAHGGFLFDDDDAGEVDLIGALQPPRQPPPHCHAVKSSTSSGDSDSDEWD